ncbi:hypothetical protein CR513_57718, partial [Mucuna pruriens]
MRTKIDVHAKMLSMEFGDTLVQFNIFEVMRHPTEDHSLFGIGMIEELVEEYFQPNSWSEDTEDSARSIISCLEADQDEAFEVELTELLDQVCYLESPKYTNNAETDSNPIRIEDIKSSRSMQLQAELTTAHLVPSPIQVGQADPKSQIEESPSPPPPMELKPLPNHLKYAYLDKEQQLPFIIANNLHQEQEDKLLEVLRQDKRAIGWKFVDLPSINPSICMHRILMEEEVKPIRQ